MLSRLYCSRKKKLWTLRNIRESVFSFPEIKYTLQKERCQVRQCKSFKVFQLLCGFLLLFYFIIWVSVARKISSQKTTHISPLFFLLLNKNYLALLPRSVSKIYRLHSAICKKFLLTGRERRKAGGRPRTGFKDLVQILISCRFYLCMLDTKLDNPLFSS